MLRLSTEDDMIIWLKMTKDKYFLQLGVSVLIVSRVNDIPCFRYKSYTSSSKAKNIYDHFIEKVSHANSSKCVHTMYNVPYKIELWVSLNTNT